MIQGLEPGWIWAIGGVLLLIAEILAPGVFLMFIGVAAIGAGAFTLLFDLDLSQQLFLFALYSGLAVFSGRRWYAEQRDEKDVLLNDPKRRLVGKTVVVVTPVDEHGGRVRVGDGEWNAVGGPAGIGERVTVTAVESNCLIVEPVRTLPNA